MEDILGPLIVFTFLYLVIKRVIDYKQAKLKAGSGSSVGMEELRSLIYEAVDEAIQPLAGRVEALERDRDQSDDAVPHKLKEAPALLLDDELEAPEEPAPVRRRARRRAP